MSTGNGSGIRAGVATGLAQLLEIVGHPPEQRTEPEHLTDELARLVPGEGRRGVGRQHGQGAVESHQVGVTQHAPTLSNRCSLCGSEGRRRRENLRVRRGSDRLRMAEAAAEWSPDVVIVVDDQFIVRYCSPATADLFGADIAEVEGSEAWSWLHPDDLAYAAGGLAEAGRSEVPHAAARIRIRTPKGWEEIDARPGRYFELPGGGRGVVLSLRPTGADGELLARRLEVESLLARVAMRCAGSPWQLLPDVARSALRTLAGTLDARMVQLLALDVSPPVVELAVGSDDSTGVPVWWDQTHDVSLVPCIAAPDVGTLEPPIAEAFLSRGLRMVVDIPINGRQGPEHALRLGWAESTLQWDDANAGTVQSLAGVLLSSLRRAETDASTHHAARHDALTGLANRRRALELLDEELEMLDSGRRRGLALLLGDLDRFKRVNDGLGHEAGDRALVEVAEALVRNVRDEDVVARYGGDEFLVICRDLSDEHAVRQLVERLEAAVAGLEDYDLGVTFGATATDRATSREALLTRADAAMYLAKRTRGAAGGPVGTDVTPAS